MKKLFGKKDFKPGLCRATVTSVHSRKFHEFDVITLKYRMVCHQTAEVFELSETFVDNPNLVRCYEFVKFLLNSDVEYDDYGDLVGLTFDAWLELDSDGENVFPVLSDKVLLAFPFKKL